MANKKNKDVPSSFLTGYGTSSTAPKKKWESILVPKKKKKK